MTYSKLGFSLTLGVVANAVITSNAFGAQEVHRDSAATLQLTSSPARCVALRQGQICYQKVEFTWQSTRSGDFCIIDASQNTPLQCWVQSISGQFNYDFQSSHSRNYVIREKNTDIDLAQHSISVAWVYRSSKRPKASWRLF